VRFLAALVCLAAPLAAQPGLVETGYDHFYNLEYPEAAAAFEKAIAQHPDDPDLHNHLAQTLVFQEMFRDGALESELVSGNNSFLRRPKLNPSPVTEARFLGELAKSMALTEAQLRKNPRDAGALYAQGIAHGLRANYYWLVKKSWRDALNDANAARRAHNQVSEIDPPTSTRAWYKDCTTTSSAACRSAIGCSDSSSACAAIRRKACGPCRMSRPAES
jgi:tetratricopeptide (TPR) repeat protein